jgi:hypothetical protein
VPAEDPIKSSNGVVAALGAATGFIPPVEGGPEGAKRFLVPTLRDVLRDKDANSSSSSTVACSVEEF